MVNITPVDKGLNVQLDSDLDEINRDKLKKPFRRRADRSIEDIEKEKENEFRMQQWNAPYVLECKKQFRMEGIDTFGGMKISRELEMVREEIRKLIDSIRVEKKYKKKKKDGSEGQLASLSEATSMQSFVKNEMDDLDKFMQEFAESEERAK